VIRGWSLSSTRSIRFEHALDPLGPRFTEVECAVCRCRIPSGHRGRIANVGLSWPARHATSLSSSARRSSASNWSVEPCLFYNLSANRTGCRTWCEHSEGGYDGSTHGWPLFGGQQIWDFVSAL
jgi:hypothetical protein